MTDKKDVLDESLKSVTGGSFGTTEETDGTCPVCNQFCKQKTIDHNGYKKLKSTGETIKVVTWKCSNCNNLYYREYFNKSVIHLSSDFE